MPMTEETMTYEAEARAEVFEPNLPIHLIDESPDNPRKHFDQAGLEELAVSIREKGVITPVIVRPKGKRFELAAGHRRRRAALLAGAKDMPALVRLMHD